MRRATLLLASVVVVGGCDSTTDPGPRWEATLRGEADYRYLMGVTVALRNGSGMHVTTSIAGAPIGTAHPWHLRAGSCASSGEVLGRARAYPLLETSAAGVASVSTLVDVLLDEEKPYHVALHASQEEASPMMACGDLVFR